MPLFLGRKSKIFLAIFLLNGAFLFILNGKTAQAYHATSSYSKLFNDTLTAQNWNDLFGDFVNTWLPVTLNGPVGIATTPPDSGLAVNGIIRGSSIRSSGNVGIGTTDPNQAARLEVFGPSGYSIMAGNLKLGNVALPTFDSDAATKGYVDSFVAAATSSISGLPAGISGQTLRHNGTDWVGNSVLFNNGTNVGIGTSNPINTLHVVSGNWDVFKIEKTGANAGSFVFGFSSTGANLQNLTGGKGVWIYNSSANVFGIDSGGNVGIGTTSPIYSLELNKPDLRLNPNSYLGLNNPTAADAVNTVQSSPSLLFESAAWNTATGNKKSYWRIYSKPTTGANVYDQMFFDYSTDKGTWTNAFFTQVGWMVAPSGFSGGVGQLDRIVPRTNINLAIGARSVNEAVVIGGGYAAMTEWARFNSTGLGIGTSTPAAKLSVDPGSGYAILAGEQRIGNVALPIINADVATKGYVDSSLASATSSISTLWGGTTGGNIWSLNSGNVGIGTAGPGAILEVYNASPLIRYNRGGSYVWEAGVGNGGTGFPNSYFGIKDSSAGTVPFVIAFSSGYVGIGTTTPAGKLNVYGNGNISALFTNGNVGIGTTNPTHQFQVGGASGINSNIIVLGGDTRIGNYAGNGVAYLQARDDSGSSDIGLQIRTQNAGGITNAIRIDKGGNVGIGTTDPSAAKLVVAQTSGYSILAGTSTTATYKIGNVATPTADTDVATLGWVNSALSSATGSITLWGGTTGGNIWNLNSGNVGIGTTTPSGNLHVFDSSSSNWAKLILENSASQQLVAAELQLKSNSSARGGVVTNYDSVSNKAWGVGVPYGGNYDSFQIGFVNSASTLTFKQTETMRASNSLLTIKSNGNVGIGTTNPGAYLQIGNATNIFAANFDATHNGFIVAPNIDYGRFAVQGNSGGSFYLGDAGAGLNLKKVEFSSDDGYTFIRSLNDAGGVNKNLLYMNNSSGNVGIGTTSPTARLEVVPTSGYSILAGSFKIGNVALPTADADAATKGYVDSSLAYATSSMITMPVGTTGQTLRHDGTDWIANSIIYNNGTNVGIGTTSPTTALTVAGGIGFGVNGANPTAVWTNVTGYSPRAFLQFANNGGVQIYDDGSEITFGTTQVSGTSRGLNWSPANRIVTFGDGTDLRVQGTGTDYSKYVTLRFNSGYGELLTTAGNLVLNPSGNVGIGTTTPAAELEVVPTSGYSILAGSFKIGNVALPTADADAATKGYVDSSLAYATSSMITMPIGTTGQTLRHNGSNWVANSVIYNDGTNVGIGTSSPVYKLDVYGDMMVTTVGGAKFRVNTNSGLNFYSFQQPFIFQSNYAGPELFSFRYGGTDRMTILQNGNVGIGTVAPDSTLHVFDNGAVTNVKLRIEDTAHNAFLYLKRGTIESSFTQDADSLDIQGSSNLNLQVTSGNVGIGTTTPTAKLSFDLASGYAILADNFKIGNVALPTADADAATKGYIDSSLASATSSITLWGGTTGGNIWNLNNGNVGIGTTTPTYKLDVKGTSATDGVRSDIGFDIYPVPNPIAPTGIAQSGAGLGIGNYYYLVTYTTALGETNSTNSSPITTTAGNQQVLLTIPVSTDPRVTGRKIYRSKVGGSYAADYFLVAITNNTETTYLDSTADTSLPNPSAASFFRINSTTKYIGVDGTRSFVIDRNLTAFGLGAGLGVTIGGSNSLFGYYAGRNISSGNYNNFFGGWAGNAVTTGSDNTIVGFNSSQSLSSGSNNTYIGNYAGRYNSTGGLNTAVGYYALGGLPGNSNGYNTALGYNSLGGVTTGGANSALGYNSGYKNTTGTYNLFLGDEAGSNASQKVDATNSMALGYNTWTTESNQFVYGNTSVVKHIFQAGNVGIGTSTPAAKLSFDLASGYAILADNFKIGNVALPTADEDAATKGYVDSSLASATSSLNGLPIGTTGQTLRHDGTNWIANSIIYNDGTNVGIGTTTPSTLLEINGTFKASVNQGVIMLDSGGNVMIGI